ncbi:MAG: phosphoribosyl-AMP cyclohydrolase [Deltaproteobacteria bacterium]|nr:MAG: phosphoribosyl-AMP cyclohydrolase [Deltaproteobacteria bacterium]
MKLLDQINYDEKGLVPAIIQDHTNNEVLMVAYMDREALKRTLESGKTHFWSRSRQKYWQKGEHSGHIQLVKEVLIDCDNDALVIKVEQKVAACHEGYRSCFFRKLTGQEFQVFQEKVFNEKDVY